MQDFALFVVALLLVVALTMGAIGAVDRTVTGDWHSWVDCSPRQCSFP
jgi:hypothetical protein